MLVDIYFLSGLAGYASESKADSETLFENLGRAEMTVVGAYPSLFTQELGYQLLEGTDESSSSETNSKYNVPIMIILLLLRC